MDRNRCTLSSESAQHENPCVKFQISQPELDLLGRDAIAIAGYHNKVRFCCRNQGDQFHAFDAGDNHMLRRQGSGHETV